MFLFLVFIQYTRSLYPRSPEGDKGVYWIHYVVRRLSSVWRGRRGFRTITFQLLHRSTSYVTHIPLMGQGRRLLIFILVGQILALWWPKNGQIFLKINVLTCGIFIWCWISTKPLSNVYPNVTLWFMKKFSNFAKK